MRTIKTSKGARIVPDGDLLAMMEMLYREVTAHRDLDRSFDDMNTEIANLIRQMTLPELRRYLQDALFVTTITYENQRTAAYVKRIRPARVPRGRVAKRPPPVRWHQASSPRGELA